MPSILADMRDIVLVKAIMDSAGNRYLLPPGVLGVLKPQGKSNPKSSTLAMDIQPFFFFAWATWSEEELSWAAYKIWNIYK